MGWLMWLCGVVGKATYTASNLTHDPTTLRLQTHFTETRLQTVNRATHSCIHNKLACNTRHVSATALASHTGKSSLLRLITTGNLIMAPAWTDLSLSNGTALQEVPHALGNCSDTLQAMHASIVAAIHTLIQAPLSGTILTKTGRRLGN